MPPCVLTPTPVPQGPLPPKLGIRDSHAKSFLSKPLNYRPWSQPDASVSPFALAAPTQLPSPGIFGKLVGLIVSPITQLGLGEEEEGPQNNAGREELFYRDGGRAEQHVSL